MSSLEKIVIENRIYNSIEECETWEAVIETIDRGLDPFKPMLRREVTTDDIVKLTEIKIKRISKFDTKKADEQLKKDLAAVDKDTKRTDEQKKAEKARLQGGGAWIHRDSACLNRAVRSRAFERALRKQGLDSAPFSQWLERYLSSGAKAPN